MYAGNTNETLVIQANGNVGIGTTGPLSPLSIQANSGGSALRFIGRSDGISGIDFFNSTQTVGNYFQSNSSWMRARADGGFHFSNGSTPIVTDTDGFTIAGMNVGIGTNSPDALLDLGTTAGQKFYVYSGSTVKAGIGVDLSGSSRELSIFNSSSNGYSDGNISFGYRNESNGAYQERMRLTSGGNLGIGVTGPTGKLQVSLSSSTEYAMVQVPTGLTSADYNSGLVVGEGHANGSINMNFWTDTANNIGFIQVSTKNSDVQPLILNPIGGNVGIGMTSPTSPLTIKSNSTSTASSGLIIQANSSTNTIVRLGERSNGRARLEMLDSGVTKIAFYTDGNHNYINAGKVGIGTTSPSAKLDVSDGTIYSIKLSNTAAYNSGINNGIVFNGKYTSAGDVTDMASVRGGKENTVDTHYGGKLTFHTRQNGLTDTERMRITSGGDLYVGTTSTNPINGFRVLQATGGTFIQIEHPVNTSSGSDLSLIHI